MMQKCVVLFVCCAFVFLPGGCYFYSTENPPPPVVIFPGDANVVVQPKGKVPSETRPAPSGPPAGEVGPPQ